MRRVAKRVDHRNRRVTGKLLDVGVREGSNRDRVDVTAEHHGGVADRLAAAQLEVVGAQVQRRPAEVRHADLEGDAGPRRGLLEDHPERAAGQDAMLLTRLLGPLQLVGEVEEDADLLRVPVPHGSETAALQLLGDLDHRRARCYSESRLDKQTLRFYTY